MLAYVDSERNVGRLPDVFQALKYTKFSFCFDN